VAWIPVVVASSVVSLASLPQKLRFARLADQTFLPAGLIELSRYAEGARRYPLADVTCISIHRVAARTPVDEMQAATAAERSRARRTFEARDRGNRSLDRFSRPPRVHYLWRLFTPRAHAAHVISPPAAGGWARAAERAPFVADLIGGTGSRLPSLPPSLPPFISSVSAPPETRAATALARIFITPPYRVVARHA